MQFRILKRSAGRLQAVILLNVWLCFVAGFVEVSANTKGDAVSSWTGAHTRLVWVQDHGDGADALAHGRSLKLYGFDSGDGRGERPLIDIVDNYFKPLITPDGSHVVFSNRLTRRMYLLEWESGKIEELGSGVAVALWQDPQPSFFLRKKTLWVYCLSGPEPEDIKETSQPLYRFPLYNPKKKQLVWNKSKISWSNIQLSRDGEVIGGLFPWPNAGVLWKWKKITQWQQFGRGCWTSLSPDNSKLLWIFDALHRNIDMYDVRSGEKWKVPINGAPSVGGYEVYHPRWSNHPRYFVVTGPYEKGEGGNKIGGGGEKVEILIGRFDEHAKQVEDWLVVTGNGRADFYPDLWIEGGGTAELADELTAVHVTTSPDPVKWPARRDNLVFIWEDMQAPNQLGENSPVGFSQSNVELRGHALHTRYFQLSMNGGWGETGDGGVKIGRALADTGRAAVEWVVSAERKQHGTIISLLSRNKPVLTIGQDGDSLVVAGNGDGEGQRWPGLLDPGANQHLVLVIDGDSVELYRNGNSAGKKPLAVDFRETAVDTFILGDRAEEWYGTLENIAVYNMPLAAADIHSHAGLMADKWNDRSLSPVSPLVVEGTLLQSTEIPPPDSLGAYRRALVVNTYSVDRLLEGEYGDERIVVAEWAILDRNVVKKYPGSPETELLVLEEFADHPELEGERQMMDIFEPELETYYRLPGKNGE
ncbi:MAG: LamG-like jellyroll fold domain-containing protein [Desulforhopalus sp.]